MIGISSPANRNTLKHQSLSQQLTAQNSAAMALFPLLVILLVGLLTICQAKSNDMPIIGVFSQPTSSKEGTCGGDCLYIASSYVKYLEAAGARVVPINYYASKSELDAVFKGINGVFFTGGSAGFPSSAQYMFDKVVAANDAGDFFPMWGTCMGFQWLLMCAARSSSILDPPSGQMDSYNLSIALDFTSSAASSRLFANAGKVFDILGTENVTMNNHHYGIYPDHFAKTSSLSSFYSMLSTNKDRKGVEFVSTIEAFKYPIYGSQWHPEKNTFEFGKTDGIPNEAINHSPNAIEIAQYTANFFVNQARGNFHAFATPEEEDAALIYNYAQAKTTGSFVQEYFFKNDF